MAYKSINGRLVKTNKTFANRNIIFQGETDWSIINWNPKIRDESREMFDACRKDIGYTEQEMIGDLIGGIGEMLAQDAKEDLTKNFTLLSSMAMYASQCETPNESNQLNQNHNYAAVVVLRSAKGFSARWCGTFCAENDLEAVGLNWVSVVKGLRPMYKLDQMFAGHSQAYDQAVALLAD